MTKYTVLLLIYLGTLCYTIAAYYHLKYRDSWSFILAFSIAVPFVLVEYVFSLYGNHNASYKLGWSPLQILVITMCFYFINLWILNFYVLKHESKIKREVIAFAFVLAAFLVSGVF